MKYSKALTESIESTLLISHFETDYLVLAAVDCYGK